MAQKTLDQLCINTIRCLAADMVQKANSGHPGMPMGMAPVAHVLWSRIMNYSPSNPKWMNRDRFVLSNGHGCALQYSLLHLAGYNLPMEELKRFRQLNSKTPGHPEAHLTEGVEVSTGPLGQGIANCVGMAIGEAHMAAAYNRPNFKLFDNFTYVFCGDGCLQEGVACEAVSLAGHLGLGKLILVYDDNHVTIDGDTDLSFSENVPSRFSGYNWHVSVVEHGDTDLDAIEKAIREAREVKDKPSIICLRTTIGFGATKQGTEAVHGAPLGADELKKVKTKFGFNPDQFFHIPNEVQEFYGNLKHRGKEHEDKWNQLLKEYASSYPKEFEELDARIHDRLPKDYKNNLPKYTSASKADATRNTNNSVLNALADQIPALIGGSADLTGSNKTELKKSKDFQKHNHSGRYLRFGVREHAMVAIGNGLRAYGGFIPFTATFLNFLEYCFPAARLAALSHFQQLLIMTHDSIGLGEDGPTHQPIEVVALCRATPNLYVFRPADGNETTGSYISAMELKHSPSVLIFTRQNLPQLERSSADLVAKGGYVVFETYDGKDKPELIYVATGSEVSIAIDAAKKSGLKTRVVSMPSTTLFDQQPVDYRRSVITPGVPSISVEALTVYGWERYSHFHVGMTTFGASAPYEACYEHFGITPDKIAARTRDWLAQLSQINAAQGIAQAAYLPTHYQN